MILYSLQTLHFCSGYATILRQIFLFLICTPNVSFRFPLKLIKEILPVIREIGEKAQDDGPSGKLNGPVSIASCGNAIQIAKHPTDIQGLIRIYHSLEGLIRFQQIWNKVSKTFGMILKKGISATV